MNKDNLRPVSSIKHSDNWQNRLVQGAYRQ